MYPDPDQIKQANMAAMTTTVAQEEAYKQASSAFDDALTLGLGAASSAASLLAEYFIKRHWATIVIGVLLAAGAIFFAFRNYSKTGKMTPMTVIGLAAATTTLVYIGNLLLAEALIRSSYHY